MSTPIVVTGASGRMGQAILTQLADASGVTIAGGTERAGHPALGQDVLAPLGRGPAGVALTDRLEDVLTSDTVVIDFTSPEATLAHLALCAEAGARAVVGTTGLDAAQRAEIAAFAERTAIMHAPNMSVGVNVLFKLVEEAARALGDDFDVEIVEAHHHHKKDAPSGTAVRLLAGVAAALGRDAEADAVHGRQGMVGARGPREIGMHALRGGDHADVRERPALPARHGL